MIHDLQGQAVDVVFLVALVHEAQAILATRKDWTARFVRQRRKVVDLTTFEEAPF